MKRTNPGEMLQDWEPMGVPPLRTSILRNPVPYLIVVHRKTSLSSRLSWIVDDQKLAESREQNQISLQFKPQLLTPNSLGEIVILVNPKKISFFKDSCHDWAGIL